MESSVIGEEMRAGGRLDLPVKLGFLGSVLGSSVGEKGRLCVPVGVGV